MNKEAEDAREYLERLRHTHDYMKKVAAELEELPFLSAVQYDKIKSRGAYIGSRLNVADQRLEKTAEYGRAVNRYIWLKHEILNQLDKLEDARYADVLYFRYVLFLNIRETARKMNREDAYTSRLHVEALKAFSKTFEALDTPAARSGENTTQPASTLMAK